MLDFTAIGSRIRKCRELQGLTREEFAEQINVSPRFVYDIELGNKGMSIDTLVSISEALHISNDYILSGTDNDEHSVLSPDLCALMEQCPPRQQEHLKTIIQQFILAVKDNQH